MRSCVLIAAMAVLAVACSPRAERQLAVSDGRVSPSAASDTASAVLATAGQTQVAIAGLTAPAAPGQWRPYRDFHFNHSSAMVRPSELLKSAAIADYAKRHPAAQFRVDGLWDDREEDLGRRRLEAVRNALIDAGVPPDRVALGSLGRRTTPGSQHVQVLLSDR